MTTKQPSVAIISVQGDLEAQSPKPTEINYFKELNGLRALAVGLVLFHHYFSQNIAHKLRLGAMGVDIFFVLSGFLITNILMSYRQEKTFGRSLKVFYTRRALRIFPLYYLYLGLVLLLFADTINKTGLLWALFYAVNFYVVSGHLPDIVYGHFWSLAVEEQFYFFWPLVILLTSRKWLKPVIIFSIVSSFLFSLASSLILGLKYTPWLHTFSCVQALGLGGLLSILRRENASQLNFIRQYNTAIVFLSLVCFTLSVWISSVGTDVFSLIRLSSGILTFALITRLTEKKSGTRDIFRRTMNWSWMQFVGKISYGIYVYHVLVQQLLEKPMHDWFFTLNPNDGTAVSFIKTHTYIVTMPLYIVLTFLISWFSFTLIEMPFTKFKRHYT